MTRDEALALLTFDDLSKGLGDARQQAAWQELEWRRIRDPEYFFDTYAWLMLKDGSVKRWELWPVQRLLLRLLESGASIASIKSRQLGVTTTIVNYYLQQAVTKPAAKSFLVADSEPKAIEALTKLRVTLDRLPKWMRDKASTDSKETRNLKADSKDGAKGVGFGFAELKVLTSTPNSVAGVSGAICLDEFGRHRDQRRVLDNAIPAFNGGGQMVIIGNGNGEDELYDVYNKALAGTFPGMEAMFFGWWDDPSWIVGATVDGSECTDVGITDATKDSVGEVFYTLADGRGLSRAEIARMYSDGKIVSDVYERTRLMYMREDPARDIYSFRVQYPGNVDEAVYLTGDSFIPIATVNGYQRLLHTGGHPKPKVGLIEEAYDVASPEGESRLKWHTNPRGKCRMFFEPDPDGIYIAGVDPSMGRGDLAVIDIERLWQGEEAWERLKACGHTDPPTVDGVQSFEVPHDTDFVLEQVFVYEGHTEPLTLAHEVEKACTMYGDAFCVVESNPGGGGAALIETLKNTYWNLYRETRAEMVMDKESEQIGFWESGKSRQMMLDMLKGWLMRGWLIVNDAGFVTQASRFGYNDQMKLTAPKGSHDDLIFAKGLTIIGARNQVVERSKGETPTFSYLDW